MSTGGYDETKGRIFSSLDRALQTLVTAAPNEAERVTLIQESDGSLWLFAEHGGEIIDVPLSDELFDAACKVVELVSPNETTERKYGLAKVWRLKRAPGKNPAT